VGIVDANRVSQDVDIRWKTPADLVMGFPIAPGGRNCLRNSLARSFMHRRLWANDPDCLVLREEKGGMNLHELRSLATAFYLLAGHLMLSENLAELPPERMALFEQMLPLPDRPARPLDLFRTDFPALLFRPGEPTSLLALFNWSDEPCSLELNLKKIGLEKTCHVFDYWSKQYLGQVERTRNLGVVAAHGCRYLALTPVSEAAQVVGLDFQFGMGTQGVARVEAAQGSGGTLVLELPGAHEGRVWISRSGGVRPLPVEFTDRAELVLAES
jgi:alpha-galactosidase